MNPRLNSWNLFSVKRSFGLFCLFEEFERFLRWAIIDYRKKDRPHQVRSVFSFCVHSAKSYCPCSEDRYSCRYGSRTRANDWICSFEISRSILEDFFISVLLWRMRLEPSFCLIIGNRSLPISFQKTAHGFMCRRSFFHTDSCAVWCLWNWILLRLKPPFWSITSDWDKCS